MRVIPILISTFLVLSCSKRTFTQVGISYESLYGDLSDGLPDKDSLATEKKNDKIIGKGSYAVTGDRLTNIKVGQWKEYDDYGILRTEGNYKMSSFTDCCTGGLCKSFYYYRSGTWRFYNDKGEFEFEIDFEPARLHVKTRCQGGDSLTFGLIKSIPIKYWDKLTTDKIYEVQKISFSDKDSNGTTTYTPLNGQLFMEYVRDK
jgi:hypothetical protein